MSPFYAGPTSLQLMATGLKRCVCYFCFSGPNSDIIRQERRSHGRFGEIRVRVAGQSFVGAEEKGLDGSMQPADDHHQKYVVY